MKGGNGLLVHTSRAENLPLQRDTVADYKKVMSTKLSFSCYSTFQYYTLITFSIYKPGRVLNTEVYKKIPAP